MDAAGDVYVTTFRYVAGLFVEKYDNAGNTLWSRNATSSYPWLSVVSIAADRNGNSFVTGYFVRDASFGQVNVRSQYDETGSFYLAKYGPNGDCLWVRTAEPSATDSWSVGHGVAVDPAGDVFVTGYFNGTVAFGTNRLIDRSDATPNTTDLLVVKYSSSGDLLWARQPGSSGTNASVARGMAIGCDQLGNVYLRGNFGGTAAFGASILTGANNFLAKYDGSGNPCWAVQAGGNGYVWGSAIAVDAAGNSFITGGFSGTNQFGAITLTSAGSSVFVAKLSANGNWRWARQASGGSGRGIALDASTNLYVAGDFRSSAQFDNFDLTSAGESDIFLARMPRNSDVEVLPALNIIRSGDALVITWPGSVAGAILETKDALTPASIWFPVETPPVVIGAQNVVTVDIGAGSQFFRLRKP